MWFYSHTDLSKQKTVSQKFDYDSYVKKHASREVLSFLWKNIYKEKC